MRIMSIQRLRTGDIGDQVAELHDRLALGGFDISTEERNRKYFGPSTRVALGELQKRHGIDPSCETCEKTNAVLNEIQVKKTTKSFNIESPILPSPILIKSENLVSADPQVEPPSDSLTDGLTTKPESDVQAISDNPGLPRPQEKQPKSHSVRGTVTDASGNPLSGIIVSALGQSVSNGSILLQSSVSNTLGYYELVIDPESASSEQKKNPEKIYKTD